MKLWMIFGGLGLLYGMAVQLCGFTRREGVRSAAALWDWVHARTLLYLLGTGMMLTALLCYLAVIDVDLLEVLPLHSGVIIGGAAAGVVIGCTGLLPGTLLCGIGGGRMLESLCGAAGCALGMFLVPMLPLEPLRTLFPAQEGTLFRLTLRDPWLLDGGKLSLACLGALLCAAAMLIRRPKTADADAADSVPWDTATPQPEAYSDEMEDDQPMENESSTAREQNEQEIPAVPDEFYNEDEWPEDPDIAPADEYPAEAEAPDTPESRNDAPLPPPEQEEAMLWQDTVATDIPPVDATIWPLAVPAPPVEPLIIPDEEKDKP